MVMIETDKDELVGRFLRENKKEVDDFGFSRRVMRRLPRRSMWAVRLWTVFCTAVAVALFFLYDGFGMIAGWFAGWMGAFVRGEFDPAAHTCLWAVLAGIAAVGIHRLCTAE